MDLDGCAKWATTFYLYQIIQPVEVVVAELLVLSIVFCSFPKKWF